MVNVKLLEHLKQIRTTLVEIEGLKKQIESIDQSHKETLDLEKANVFYKVIALDKECEIKSKEVEDQYTEDRNRLIESIELNQIKAQKIESKEIPALFAYLIKGLKKIQFKQFKLYPETILEWAMFLGVFWVLGFLVGFFSEIWKYSIWGIAFLGMPSLQIANTTFYRERRLKIHPKYKNVIEQIELLEQNLKITDQELETKINEVKHALQTERNVALQEAELRFDEISMDVSRDFHAQKTEKEAILDSLSQWLKNPQESEIINPEFHSLKTMDLFIRLVENQQAHSVKELMDRYESLVRDEEARMLENKRQQELIEIAKQKEARLISIEEEKLKVEKERYAAEMALKNLKEELEKINIYEHELVQMIESCHGETEKIKLEKLEEPKMDKKLKSVYKKIELYESKLEESRAKKHQLLLSSDGHNNK